LDDEDEGGDEWATIGPKPRIYPGGKGSMKEIGRRIRNRLPLAIMLAFS
jgi:hypothetical protein